MLLAGTGMRKTGESTTSPSSHASRLTGFLVRRVLAAPPAVLPVLNAPGLLFLVLGGGVVAALALGALKSYDISHDGNSIRSDSCVVELATGIEPVTSSLPRKCSTN